MNPLTQTVLAISMATAATGLLAGHAGAAEGPAGTWKVASGKVTVKIEYCETDRLCGNIVALAKPLDKQGKPKVDRKNPNPALRSRPMVGLVVFNAMKPEGPDSWSGKIYNADDGTTYRATAKLDGNKFTVKACWTFICKKIKFNRVTQP
jgi:uncharacterized protein (DUF2147 family)